MTKSTGTTVFQVLSGPMRQMLRRSRRGCVDTHRERSNMLASAADSVNTS